MPYRWDGCKTHELITKVDGEPVRHIEQLWDEIHKLKEINIKLVKRIEELENTG